MKLAFSIAWRFLSSNKGQTLLIALGIGIGVSVQVFIGSLIGGLQEDLVDTTIGNASQVTVKPLEREDTIPDYPALMDALASQDDRLTAISPTVDASGFVRYGEDTFPVLLRGFDLPLAEAIYQLEDALVEGSLPRSGEILLGSIIMAEARLRVGDTVELLTPFGVTEEVVISGIFDLKVSSLNRSWAVTTMDVVQDLFALGNIATAIEMQVADVFLADVIAENLGTILPEGLKADNWKAENEALLGGLNGQSVSSLMIQVFVLVSVVLGIASVLAISVLQKSKQLGILKAMGIRNGTASLIFLFQGLILGIFGAFIGVGLGLFLTVAFTRFARNPDGTPVINLLIDPGFIVLSGFVAVLAATLASLIPARRSSKLDPIEVIRNG